MALALRYFIILLVFCNTSPALAKARKKATPSPAVNPASKVLARYFANKQALEANEKKQKVVRKEVDGIFAEIKRLRTAKKAGKNQERCDVCEPIAAEFCNRPALHPEFCRDADCHVEIEPPTTLCLRVYQNESCYKALTPTARAKVNECWMVDNHLEVKELEVEIDNLRKQLDDLTAEQFDLMKYELALEEECPACPKMRVPAEIRRAAETDELEDEGDSIEQ